MIVPLTTDYAHFRDYALLTLGFEENSASILPLYDVKIYYPPGSSLVTGVIHMILKNINPVAIMITLAHFFMFIIIILFYLVGKIGLNNQKIGIFFSSAFLIGSVSRNFVTGGATIPSLLATVCGLIFLIYLLKYLTLILHEDENEFCFKTYSFLGLFLGATAISHFDTLLTFSWGVLSIAIIYIILRINNYKKILKFFLIIGLIAFLIASPFLLRSYNYKKTLDAHWTDELWDGYSKDEIHPKPIDEIMFFTGHLLFLLGIIGILTFIILFLYSKFKRKNIEQIITEQNQIFFIAVMLWLIFIFISNSFFFLRLARPIFLFYAINIILWHGITIPLTFGAGLLFYLIYKKLIPIKYSRYFFAFIFFLTIISIINYETINYPKTFSRQGGFLMLPFADRAGYVNLGDLEIFKIIKMLPYGMIVHYPYLAGQETMVFTQRPTYIYFTHEFYDDLEQNKWMFSRQVESGRFFEIINDSFIKEKNISYIFIPSEISTDEYNSSLLLKYKLLARSGGAKLLSEEKTKNPIIHVEVENNASKINNPEVKQYKYTGMLNIATIELKQNQSFEIKIKIPAEEKSKILKFNEGKIQIYIKHLTFLKPLSFDIIINNNKYTINKTSSKVTFSESYINTTIEEIDNKSIRFVGTSKGIDFFKIKKYYPEIDWIEITGRE